MRSSGWMTQPSRAQLYPGVVLEGRYRIERRLGVGGMGEVFLATRLSLGDAVAIKCLLPSCDSPEMRARFLLEVQTAARVRHPSVVEIHDFGEPRGGLPYMVMEYLEGPTLAEVLERQGALPVERALPLFAEICAAVEAAHRRGVVHRDLKPANVIIARSDDGRALAKVLDFGIAQRAGAGRRLTSPGAIVGTACYMAPEQVLGEEVGPGADIFSLGVMLYELVTGARPFEGARPAETLMRTAEGRYAPPEERVPDLPEAVRAAIARALQRVPEDRPSSTLALAAMAGAGAGERGVDRFDDATTMMTTARGIGGHAPTLHAPVGELQTGASAPELASTGVGATAARTEARGDRVALAAPQFERFVGRARELERLRERWAAAGRNEQPIAIVTGASGVGKTRLVRALCESLREGAAPPLILRGRFFAYEGEQASSFATFLGMLDGASPGRRPPTSGEYRLVGPGAADASARSVVEIVEAFAARIEGRRALLVFDDLHAARRVELELIDHLRRLVAARGGLVVATLEREGAGADVTTWLLGHTRRRSCALLELGPLDAGEVRDWLSGVFGALRLRPQELQRLLQVTGGNPYYLEETVRHLVVRGALRRDQASGSWVFERFARGVDALPETIGSLVRARLEALDADPKSAPLRATLEQAAALGDEFCFDTLQLACGLDEDALEEQIELALARQLLDEDGVSVGNDYRFHGPALREVLYAGMSRRRRRRAHKRAVAALRERYPGESRRLAHALAYHHEALQDWPAALRNGLVALEAACARQDNARAEQALARAERARDQLERDGEALTAEERARFAWLAGVLHSRTGRFEQARADLLRADEAARAAGDAALSLEVALTLARCLLGLAEHEEAVRTADDVHARAEAKGAREVSLRARVFAASVRTRQGRTDEAARRIEEVLRALDGRDPEALRAEAHRERAWQHLKLGEYLDAERHVERALTLARASHDRHALYSAISAKAALLAESQRSDEALAVQQEALELARGLCLRRREAIELANLGEAYFELGDIPGARGRFLEALEIFIEIGDRACEGDCRVNVGRALLRGGELADAIAMLERARELCAATERQEYAAIASLHLGEAYLQRGALDDAELALASAHESFREQASPLTWRAAFVRARLARARGDEGAARGWVEEALERLARRRERLPAHVDPRAVEAEAQPVRALLAALDRDAQRG